MHSYWRITEYKRSIFCNLHWKTTLFTCQVCNSCYRPSWNCVSFKTVVQSLLLVCECSLHKPNSRCTRLTDVSLNNLNLLGEIQKAVWSLNSLVVAPRDNGLFRQSTIFSAWRALFCSANACSYGFLQLVFFTAYGICTHTVQIFTETPCSI